MIVALKQKPWYVETSFGDIDAHVQMTDDEILDYLLSSTPMSYVRNRKYYKKKLYIKLFADEINVDTSMWATKFASTYFTDLVAKTVDKFIFSKDEERTMFMRLNYAKYRVQKLQKVKRKLTGPEAKRLIHWFKVYHKIRHDITEANYGLIPTMARTWNFPPYIQYADVLAEANIALMRALEKFDVFKGFRFSTYACQAIWKQISRTAYTEGRYYKRNTKKNGEGTDVHNFSLDEDLLLEENSHIDEEYDPDSPLVIKELLSVLEDNRAELTDIEREVIKCRFPLNDRTKAKTLEQIGKRVGVTKERIRQVQNKALLKLRDHMDKSDAPDLQDSQAIA